MLLRPFDELLPYFPTYGDGLARIPGYEQPLPMFDTASRDPHHIFGGRMGRWDRIWNLAAVSRPTHEFCERFKTDGRVIALRMKLDKREWNEADAYACLKMHPLGWIQGQSCEHQFAENIRVEIVRRYPGSN